MSPSSVLMRVYPPRTLATVGNEREYSYIPMMILPVCLGTAKRHALEKRKIRSSRYSDDETAKQQKQLERDLDSLNTAIKGRAKANQSSYINAQRYPE